MNVYSDDKFCAVVYDLEDLPDSPLRDLDYFMDIDGVLAAWRMPDLECKYTPIVVLLKGPNRVEVYAPNGTVTPDELATIRDEAEKEPLMLEDGTEEPEED